MYLTPRIDAQQCQTCDACRARRACRTRAIVQIDRGDLPIINASRCHGCLICIPECPHGAIVHPVPPHASRSA